MIDPKNLEQEVLEALRRAVPGGLAQDLEKNLRAALNGVFARLNLVTREELEVQEQVLARTRTRLEALERQVAELERALNRK
jgi:BMFP domain-containing protein YqiC